MMMRLPPPHGSLRHRGSVGRKQMKERVLIKYSLISLIAVIVTMIATN